MRKQSKDITNDFLSNCGCQSLRLLFSFCSLLGFLSHPDKVKLAVNQTIEDVSNYFVDLTKAYKALTDETVRENLRLYGNPDGKQDFKVGIALPPWIIESSNNGWVLGSYALLIGGVLPYFVGRWWFGSRKYTKDGVQGRTAESFFKALGEDDTITDVVRTFAQGWQFEANTVSFPADLDAGLRNKVEQALGSEQWIRVSKARILMILIPSASKTLIRVSLVLHSKHSPFSTLICSEFR